MTLALTRSRLLSPLVAVLAGLFCLQAACSLTSLDYLKNGGQPDSATGSDQDIAVSTPDTASPGSPLLDAHQEDSTVPDVAVIDAPPATDSLSHDSLVAETSTPGTAGLDSALLDATVADKTVPDARVLDASLTSDTKTPDAGLGADTVSAAGGGKADAGTAQGGSGGHSSSGGSTSSSGGTSSIGGASSSGGTSNTGGAHSSGGSAGAQSATGGHAGSAGGNGGSSGSTTSPACSGVPYAGVCWYLGPDGSSCQDACASHGQTSPNAASHVGTKTQGGSLAECAKILGLLGITGTPSSTLRLDGRGLGCYQKANSNSWWLSAPDYGATASLGSVRRVCGCTQ
jgi:hypothetical protein